MWAKFPTFIANFLRVAVLLLVLHGIWKFFFTWDVLKKVQDRKTLGMAGAVTQDKKKLMVGKATLKIHGDILPLKTGSKYLLEETINERMRCTLGVFEFKESQRSVLVFESDRRIKENKLQRLARIRGNSTRILVRSLGDRSPHSSISCEDWVFIEGDDIQ